jgi:hypothetical protein
MPDECGAEPVRIDQVEFAAGRASEVSVRRITFLPGAFGRCGKVTATAVK